MEMATVMILVMVGGKRLIGGCVANGVDTFYRKPEEI